MTAQAATLQLSGHIACPGAPQSVQSTGIPAEFLGELSLKVLLLRGRLMVPALADVTCLPRSVVRTVLEDLRREQLVEIARGGTTELQAEYQLTERGRSRAGESIARCAYAGPAPVSLESYEQIVGLQSMSHATFSGDSIRRAFGHVILQHGVLDQIGAAMNSGRAILLYGPAGSGKTHLAELLTHVMAGSVLVPHALYVAGDVVQVFDPLVHRPFGDDNLSSGVKGGLSMLSVSEDKRWVRCSRPLGITGGELTLPMLDLQYDHSSRIYQAPPHMKSNGGVFVIDDLGRQLVGARELMNRWIVPLDRQKDYLSLNNGFKFTVPFDLTVVFSTNLHPTELADEAFLRRFGYKIYIGSLEPDQYRAITRNVCELTGVQFDGAVLDWLIEERHKARDKPLLACYPRDLLGRVHDFALYENLPPVMTREALDRAWSSYFVHTNTDPAVQPVRVPEGVNGLGSRHTSEMS